MPITQEDVDSACEQLTAGGERTTITAVTGLVGGGSTGTIRGMIKVWETAHAERTALRQIPVPDAIADDMSISLARLWRDAMAHATAGHEAMRRDLIASRADAETVEVELLGRITVLEDALAARERETAALLARQATFDSDRTEMADRVISAETAKARAEARAETSAAEAHATKTEAAAALTREDRMRDERDAARRDAIAQITAIEERLKAAMTRRDAAGCEA
ncbi:DNA-binding protein [Jannaschia donghaensis]|uniref:KfrA N-terminal DNA-binding domain-containing protein n=1 Tax=Jannaschia donghaensis TaxID=420998 RepID=A0A0M6YLT4_9RHOB|nr:DNA-binding protein [Jannaschia donghaensis]CTQ51321.1 hypothetical protein JDO7802_03360 [Jannaschia donghaensis]